MCLEGFTNQCAPVTGLRSDCHAYAPCPPPLECHPILQQCFNKPR
jgi:hypothetical protein